MHIVRLFLCIIQGSNSIYGSHLHRAAPGVLFTVFRLEQTPIVTHSESIS